MPSKSKRHLDRLKRRAYFLEKRIETRKSQGKYDYEGDFDQSELSALRWAIEKLQPPWKGGSEPETITE